MWLDKYYPINVFKKKVSEEGGISSAWTTSHRDVPVLLYYHISAVPKTKIIAFILIKKMNNFSPMTSP